MMLVALNMQNEKRHMVVVDAGINHQGDLDLAKKLILMAHSCGCDAIKFQKRTPEICIPENIKTKIRITPWGEMTYLEYKKRMEFGKNEYDQIDAFCKEIGIDWFASAWDIPSLNFLKKYDCPYNKVASAMITNIPLLHEIANDGKKTFISTAMCTMNDIKRAVGIFKENLCPFVLMHCVAVYPLSNEQLNLNMITTLRNEFDCDVGYSDHSTGVLPPVIAATLGATVIEKHITLDRAMIGTDHAASMEKRGLELMIQYLRELPIYYGDGNKKMVGEEVKKLKSLKYW